MSERVHVKSSNIASVGYDAETRVLEVEFHGGRVYRFYDVPAESHAKLMAAESIGGEFARSIRNVFKHEAVAEQGVDAVEVRHG
jgi:hypothetical protein